MQFRDVRPSSGFHACRSDLLERRCREKLPAPQSGRHERRLLVHWPSVRGLPPAPYHSNAQWPTLLLREAYRQTFHPTILACARRHHRHLRICRKREPSVLKLSLPNCSRVFVLLTRQPNGYRHAPLSSLARRGCTLSVAPGSLLSPPALVLRTCFVLAWPLMCATTTT